MLRAFLFIASVAGILVSCGQDPDPRPLEEATGREAVEARELLDQLLAQELDEASEDAWLEQLHELSLDQKAEEKVSLSVRAAIQLLEAKRELRVCRNENWNVSATDLGWIRTVIRDVEGPTLDDSIRLERLHAVPRRLEDHLAKLRRGLRDGQTAPRLSVEATIALVTNTLAPPLEDSPLGRVLHETRDSPRAESIRSTLETEVLPALSAYQDFLLAEVLPHARRSPGLSELTEGRACWEASLRWWSGLRISPESVARRGHERLAELEPSAEDRDRVPSEDHLLLPGEALEIIRLADHRASARFPPSTPGPSGRQPLSGHAGHHDDTWPPSVSRRRLGLEALAFHHGRPGHLYQKELEAQLSPLDEVVRRLGPGDHAEGWAVEAESLAARARLYSEPVGRWGWIERERIRSAALILDPALHLLGWPLDEGMSFLRENTILTDTEASELIQSIIAHPGREIAGPLIAAEIRRLRVSSRKRLGQAFDLETFERRTAARAALPWPLLLEDTSRWIEGLERTRGLGDPSTESGPPGARQGSTLPGTRTDLP